MQVQLQSGLKHKPRGSARHPKVCFSAGWVLRGFKQRKGRARLSFVRATTL